MWGSALLEQGLWGVKQGWCGQVAQQVILLCYKTNLSLLEKWCFPQLLVPSSSRHPARQPADNSAPGLGKHRGATFHSCGRISFPKLFVSPLCEYVV